MTVSDPISAYTYMHTHIHACNHTHTNTLIHIYIHAHVLILTHTHSTFIHMHSYMHIVMSADACAHALLCPQVLSHSLLYVLPDHSGYIVDLAADCGFPSQSPLLPAGEAAQCTIGLRWLEVRRIFPAPRKLLFRFSL